MGRDADCVAWGDCGDSLFGKAGNELLPITSCHRLARLCLSIVLILTECPLVCGKEPVCTYFVNLERFAESD